MSDLAKGRRRSKAQPKIWEGRPIMNYWTPGNHEVHRKAKICEEKVRNQTNWGTFVKILCERPLETLGSLGTSPSVLFFI